MKILLAALLIAGAVQAASAQTMDWRRPHKPKEDPPPIALALDLTFSATFWNEVQVSTMGAVADLTELSRAGCYKLEIIQLVLMSRQGHQPLAKTFEKRRKGAALESIAAGYGLDYDKLYESALAVQEIVDRDYLPRFPEKRPRKERDEW